VLTFLRGIGKNGVWAKINAFVLNEYVFSSFQYVADGKGFFHKKFFVKAFGRAASATINPGNKSTRQDLFLRIIFRSCRMEKSASGGWMGVVGSGKNGNGTCFHLQPDTKSPSQNQNIGKVREDFGGKFLLSGEVRIGRSKAIRSSLPDPGSFNPQ